MKKSIVVLLIMVLVSSFAFAVVDFNNVDAMVYPKDSLTLNGEVSAKYVFNLKDTEKSGFDDSATVSYFNLDASKVLVSGLGSFMGEGDIYAAVNASLEVKASLDHEVADWDDDGTWTITNPTWDTPKAWNFAKSAVVDFEKIAIKMNLKIDDFYLAKDGAWKLNLMKSDAYLNYATSSIDSVKAYNDDSIAYTYKEDGKTTVYASYALPLDKNLGAILTLENNAYLSEVSFGMTDSKNFNILAKSADVALDNVTFALGLVAGKEANTGMIGTGLKLAYADDVVTATAAADFGFENVKDADAFNADVQFDVAAAGFKGNFYYATEAPNFYLEDYTCDAFKVGGVAANSKYASAKIAYAFDYAGVEFEAGLKGQDLNYDNRTFGFVFSAANDAFTFDAEIDWTPREAASVEKPEVKGDFDVTYTAPMFDVYADFEFKNVEGADTLWGIKLGVETDKVVAGATFGLDFTYTSEDLTAKIFDIKPKQAISAFCTVAF